MSLPCPRCSRRTRPDARFCDACGLALPGIDAAPADAAQDSGREAELANVEQRVRAALAGSGGIVALCGEPGIGKSHTAQEIARRAALQGMHVSWGRCNEEAGAPPYWPWQQVLQAWADVQDEVTLQRVLGRAADVLAGLLPDLAHRLPGLRPPSASGDPLQARFRLFEAIAGVCKRAAQEQPLLFVLENVHWADASSLRLLEFLAPELAGGHLLMLVTYRDMELSRQHPLSATLASLSAQRGFERLRLAGLQRLHTARLMQQVAGTPVPPLLVDQVQERTEGHPLFIAEMTRLLVQEGALDEHVRASGAPQRIPEGIKEVIGRRLNRLADATNEVLSCAAAIGRHFDAALLARVLRDVDEDACARALEEALQARVIEALPEPGRYRFGHALIRETLYEEIAPPRRSRLHLRIAQAIEAMAPDAPGVAATLAFHHAAALPGGDPQRAVAYARRAADEAAALLAHEEAARYCALALDGMDAGGGFAPGERCAVLTAQGEAHTRAGDYLLAQQVFERAARLARQEELPQELARAALGMEVATWCPGMPGVAAAAWLREALDLAPADDLAGVARLLSALARALIYSGEEAQAMDVHEEALRTARRCGDPRIMAMTLVATLSARWQHERRGERIAAAEEARRLAAQSGDRAIEADASAWAMFDHFETGDMTGWTAAIAAYERLAEELREPFLLYVTASSRTMHALMEGRFAEAEQLAQQTLAIGARMPGLDAAGVYGVQMFTLRRDQGRLAELGAAVKHIAEDAAGAPLWRPGLALVYAELGHREEARREFERVAAGGFDALPRDGVRTASLAYLAQVCATLGDTERARALYALLLPSAGCNLLAGTTTACVGAADMLLGMLAATQQHWDVAEAHFRAALAFNARQGARPALAHTRRQFAAMLLARNVPADRAEAAQLLAAAAQEALALGMQGLAAEVAAMQAVAGGRTARIYPAGLSEREAQVLRFVAAGRSNRQIADVLFVSPNTVANHVRSILSKTRSNNRTEAAAFAIQHELTAQGDNSLQRTPHLNRPA